MKISVEQVYKCNTHQKSVKMISLDNNCQPNSRMLCQKCFDESNSPQNVIGVEKAKQMIIEKLLQRDAQMESTINPQLEKLKNLTATTLELRNSVIKNIDGIITLIEKWQDELKNVLNKNKSMDLVQGLGLYFQNDDTIINNLNDNCKAYQMKIGTGFQRLQTNDGIQKCLKELISLQSNCNQQKNSVLDQPIVNKKQGKITHQLVNEIEQEEECQAIAFNNTGTLMVAGFLGDIKVWQFNDGKINELAQLKGQSKQITCLIFSKMNQWFISGDLFGNIQSFKQGKSNKEWLGSNIQKKHPNLVTCLILNQKEDQLISCGILKTIVAWQVNYSSNQLEYSYTLENKHTSQVNGLSLNEQNTLLISCGHDCQIILWIRGTDDKWKFKNSVTMQYPITRICFINDFEFIVQQEGLGYSNVFQIEDSSLKLQENEKIKLTDDNKNGNDCFLFPTIYNKKMNIIIQKSDKFVYIIRREISGQFKVQAQPIDCEIVYNYGALTDNGQYLAIWIEETSKLRIYKLNYE